MPTSRRSLLAAAGGLVSLNGLGFAHANPANGDAGALIQRSAEANAALMRGDIETYLSMITLTEDFTLMSPFGGTPTRGPLTDDAWQEMGQFFRNGTLKQELVQSYVSPDMVVLAIIERANVEVGGLPAQDWSLRVTLVYRREGSAWRLAHRHADPLAHRINLNQAALLARGDYNR